MIDITVYECSWSISRINGEHDEADGNADEVKAMNVQPKQGKNQRRRVYGKGIDNFFNHEDEICTFEAMSKAQQGPRLLGRFATGRIEEFLHARVSQLFLSFSVS